MREEAVMDPQDLRERQMQYDWWRKQQGGGNPSGGGGGCGCFLMLLVLGGLVVILMAGCTPGTSFGSQSSNLSSLSSLVSQRTNLSSI